MRSNKGKTPNDLGGWVRGLMFNYGKVNKMHVITNDANVKGKEISPREERLLSAFRNLAYEAQEMTLRATIRSANNPVLRRAPQLRVIAGGAA